MVRDHRENGNAPSTSETALSEAFLRLGDALLADFDVPEFLTTFAIRCAELAGVDAAGVTIVGVDGRLTLRGASCQAADRLQRRQQRMVAAPLRDGMVARGCGQHPDLTERTPWPEFAEVALAAGYHAVLTVPMRLRDTRLGAATLYRAAPGRFEPATVELAQALADIATMSVLLQRASTAQQQAVSRLAESLPRQRHTG